MPRSFVVRRNTKLAFSLNKHEDLKCAKMVYHCIQDTSIEKVADLPEINCGGKASCDDTGVRSSTAPSSKGVQKRVALKPKESRDDTEEKPVREQQRQNKEVDSIPKENQEDNENGTKTIPDVTETPQGDEYCLYECSQCGKTFKNIHTYTIHTSMPKHTRARPFACRTCGKGFRLPSTLSRHKVIHTNQRLHKCQICGKAFNRSSTLSTHMKTHDNYESFSCQICRCDFHDK